MEAGKKSSVDEMSPVTRSKAHIFDPKPNPTRNHFELMAEFSPALMWEANGAAQFIFFNKSWYLYTGKAPTDECGMGWTSGIFLDDKKRSMETMAKAFQSGQTFEFEFRLKRWNEEYRWVLFRGAPKFSEEGEVVGYTGFATDINELKIREEEFKKAIEAREEFLSLASHELKTPLTALGLQMDVFHHLLERKNAASFFEPERNSSVLSACRRQLKKLSDLIDGLLDMSRISRGQLKLEMTEFNLSEVAKECVERFRPIAFESQCDLQISIQEGAQLRGDRVRMEQVFSNLISNALKYGPAKPVEICLEQSFGQAHFRVKDHGVGIETSEQKSIFEKFYRSEKTRNYGGLGLGLFIVREIVEAHKGRVWFESTPGQGSEFHVELLVETRASE